jgi:phosphoesterase RecJ-like protein
MPASFEREFSQVARLVEGKNKILLATHEHPDGDALGSLIAMFSVLTRMSGKEVVMFSKDRVPAYFSFLPYVGRVVQSLEWPSFTPDLFFAFDYGDFKRIHVEPRLLENIPIVTFDHHPLIGQRGDVVIIDPTASSTCEVLYHFFRHAKYEIFGETAAALLAGIFTDTGGFAHVNTTTNTLKIVGDLLRYGTSLPRLHKHTFSRKSPRMLHIWGEVLKNIVHDTDLCMAYAVIPFLEFCEFGSSLDDFEGITNVLSTPPEVRFSLLLVEHEPGVLKGSLRSEPFKNVDVSSIARAFGGGGHTYAAGFEARGESLQDVVQYVKDVAKSL